jgi:TetR/AcrR family transcriptional regulator, cholesterol catabolism regulator
VGKGLLTPPASCNCAARNSNLQAPRIAAVAFHSASMNSNSAARFQLPEKSSKRKGDPRLPRPHHSPASNGSKTKGKAGTRLEEVLRSATNIFFAKGFHATSIEDVARDVGMLKGSLYYYIKSKDDLLFKLLLAGIEDGDAFIARQIDPEGEPVEQLERAIRAQIDYIIQNKVPFGLFLHEFDSLPGKRQHKLTAVMSRYNNRFVELVQKGQKQGKLMKGEPWIIVNGMLGMCNWLYRWYDTDHISDTEQIKQAFIEMIFRGIRKN